MPREARGKKGILKPAYAGKIDFFDKLRGCMKQSLSFYSLRSARMNGGAISRAISPLYSSGRR